MNYTSRDIDVVEEMEAVRRRPAMYIGDATPERSFCSRLVESIVGNVAAGPPSPTAVRLSLWSGGAMTVAFDGEPLSIEMRERPGGILHPELYAMFMNLRAHGRHPGKRALDRRRHPVCAQRAARRVDHPRGRAVPRRVPTRRPLLSAREDTDGGNARQQLDDLPR